MITTNVITLAFSGDGMTKSFDVRIEGIPIAPEGKDNFVVTRLTDGDETAEVLQYGIDYRYAAHFNPRGFSEYFTLEFAEPLPAGQRIVVLRTTPVIGISQYPDSGVPPKKVERDFDHVIKILQEQGYDITELRSDLDAEIATRAEADATLTQAIEDETRERAQADTALDERLDAAEDGFEGILEECRDVLEEVKETQEIITDLSHGDLGGPVSTVYFTSDGVATSYTVPRPKIGRHILLMAFEVPSRRRIYFSETTPTDGSIVLTLAEPLPVSARFGVVFLRSVNVGDGDAVNSEYVHIQNEVSDTWVIEHDLVADYPRVFITDSDGNTTVGGMDWSRAAEKIVTITFCEPISGKAILSV